MSPERQKLKATDTMELGIGMRCIKYLLCAVNFFFVMSGIMMILIGSIVVTIYENFSSFLDSRYYSPAMLLVIIGGLIFVIAFCGFCGAIKESTCLVSVFAVSLILVLILELSAAMASYLYRDVVMNVINDKINSTMHAYETNIEARYAINFLQTNLECCGYKGPRDWLDIATNSTNVYNVPDSCCNSLGPYFESTGCAIIYKHGCYDNLAALVDYSIIYVVLGAIMIALLQFSGIVFAFTLGRSIRFQKTKREMKRWEQRYFSTNEPQDQLH